MDTRLKEQACGYAMSLLDTLEYIMDEEFVDAICLAISSNDSFMLREIQEEICDVDEMEEYVL